MEKEQLKDLECEFENIGGIDSLMCVLGLNFPESATVFQKSFLCLAHLMASARDYVLKGVEVPDAVINWINLLNSVIYASREWQK